MALTLFLEHDDAAKSKRALIIGSFVLIFLSRIEFESSNIEVTALKIEVSKDSIILFVRLINLYFFGNFLLFVLADRAQEQIKALEKNISEGGEKHDSRFNDGNTELWIEHTRLHRWRFAALGLRDVVLPGIIFILSMTVASFPL
ncbi:MAG: hypothetical protein ACFBWO_06030 [Paracoccaceae bacterium]